MQVWVNAWDVFRRTPSRDSRGRRGAVDFLVCFECGGISCDFFSFFCFERTRPAASTKPPCLIYIYISNEAVFCFEAKKPLHTGVRTGCHYLISMSVCLSVCNIRRFY